MKNNSLIIIAYSKMESFQKHSVLRLAANYDEVIIICPIEQMIYHRLTYILKRKKSGFLKFLTRVLIKLKVIRNKGPSFVDIRAKEKRFASLNSVRYLLRCTMNLPVSSCPTPLTFGPGFLVEGYKLNKKLKALLDSDGGELFIDGVDAAPYLLDTLQHHAVRYKVNRHRSLLNSINSTIYLATFLAYISFIKNTIAYKADGCLINHDVYMESGFIAEWLKKNYGAKVFLTTKGLQKPMEIDPPEKWLKSVLRSQVRHEIVSPDPCCNKKCAYLSALGDLRHQRIDRDRVLVVMHAFTDANALHFSRGSIFTSYYQWIRATLDLARQNRSTIFWFRIHPDSYERYLKDFELINEMFKSPPGNVVLENPYSHHQHFSNSSPIVVTGRGNISREVAMAGLKAICISEPNCPPGGYLQVNTRDEYAYWLSGSCETKMLKLSEPVIENAKIQHLQYKRWIERKRAAEPDEDLVFN